MRTALLAMALLGAGCECDYGGAGCDLPLLTGLCTNEATLGDHAIGVGYFDDTGIQPSSYGDLVAVPADRVTVDINPAHGSATLHALATGPAELRVVDALGWKGHTFYWTVSITDRAPVECEPEGFLDPDPE